MLNYFRNPGRLFKAIIILVSVLTIMNSSAQVFAQDFGVDQLCRKASSHYTLLTIDGVTLNICSKFSTEQPFNIPLANDSSQIASSVSQAPKFQELSIIAIPFNTRPGTEDLPVAEEGSALLYRSALQEFRKQQGGIVITGPRATFFNRKVPSIISIVRSYTHVNEAVPVAIAEWIAEAGNRVWIIRASQELKQLSANNQEVSSFLRSLSDLTINSTDVNLPSTSLQARNNTLPLPSSQPRTIGVNNLASPWWWSGDCDTNNYSRQAGRNAYSLGGSYQGVKACGPRPYADNAPDVLVRFFAGAWGEYEWECVELVMRYLYLAYGISPYSANGSQVVPNYGGTRLVKINNGSVGRAPKPGDIISYGATSTFGHTAIVIESNVGSNGNGTIKTLNQNLTADGYSTHNVSNWQVQSANGSSYATGWLHDSTTDQTCTAPSLNSPGDGATVNSRGVTFDWNDSTCSGTTGYTLHVTTGSGPEDGIIFDSGVGQSQYNYSFPRDGTFYWHVATLYNGQRSGWSSRRIVVNTSQPQCSNNADQITLYANPDFGVPCVTLGVGEYANPGALGSVGNDNTRSVRVGANVQAILCKDDNYGGCDTPFTGDDSNLSDNGVGSYTSSVKVQPRSVVPNAPSLITPPNGATLPADHDLTFAWNAASGASQYLLEWWGGPYNTMQPCGWSSATSCHIGQIARGYSYSWHVKARNSAGNESGWGETWGFSTKLSTPANLQARPVSCSQIDLSWTDNVGGEDGFLILQNGTPIAQTGANSTSYQNTGLDASTAYSYAVKAFKGVNMSDASNTATATTDACPQRPSAEFDAWPGSGEAPLTVAMHIVSTDHITSCAWDYGDGATGNSCASLHDHVYANPGSYTVRLTVTGPGGSDSQTRPDYITVLPPACDDAFEPDDDTTHLHDFAIGNTETHAFCQANDQDWVALPATAGAIYRIETLNLAPGTDTVLELYQGDDSAPLRVDDDGNGGQASLIVWQPTSTDTYYLKVRDYHGTGDPHHTYDLRVTATTAPQPPSDMAAGSSTETSASFSWRDNSNNETGFKIYKWGFDGSVWEFYFLATVGSNVTSFTDTNLSCSGDYFYNVSAYNAIGESSRADWVKVSTTACAPPTASFDATPQSGNAPLSVAMRNSSSGSYTSCLWEYGDGSTGSLCDSSHSHVYANAGSYTVRLTVSGPGGSNTQTRANYIVVAAAPPAARLTNGDFELDVNGDGRPDGWSTNNSFTTTTATKHGGNYAGRHFATSNASYTIAQTVSNLQAGKSYSFKAFVNIPTTKDSFTFKLAIKWIDAKGKTLRTDTVKSYTKTTGTSNGGWNQVSASYKAPSGTAKAEVQMVVSSLNATIFVDDFTLN